MCKIEVLTGEEVLFTRPLWEEVFYEDSEAFTEYYFTHKAKENICFVIKDAQNIISMVHLTPYELCVTQEKSYNTCYIVGVATKRQYRHKGYMTQLLEAAFEYMKDREILFTFLMPANPKIYEPFGFQYIYERTDYHLNLNWFREANLKLHDTEQTEYKDRMVSIKKAEKKDCMFLAEFAMEQLCRKYHFFLKRDASYYSRLICELNSQNGGICMVYVDKTFAGYFFYAQERDVFIQEVLLKEEFEPLLVGDDSSFLEPQNVKKPIIMGKYLGDSKKEASVLKDIAEGKIHGGFINEIV